MIEKTFKITKRWENKPVASGDNLSTNIKNTQFKSRVIFKSRLNKKGVILIFFFSVFHLVTGLMVKICNVQIFPPTLRLAHMIFSPGMDLARSRQSPGCHPLSSFRKSRSGFKAINLFLTEIMADCKLTLWLLPIWNN